MEGITTQRLILKENDVLVVKVPSSFLTRRDTIVRFYERIKKTLPKKNKILLLPLEVELTVIGEKEVEEYISKVDLWNLWSLNEEENEL